MEIKKSVNHFCFYLKINFQGKNKKFIVRNINHINLEQIKNSFTPPISAQHLKMTIYLQNEKKAVVTSQSMLIQQLNKLNVNIKHNVKVVIEEDWSVKQDSILENEEQQLDLILPQNLKKIRSKSHDFDLNFNSQVVFVSQSQLEATQQFLYNSLILTYNKLKEAQNYVLEAQANAKKLKQQSGQTDIGQLLKYLSQD